jgi:hypothetical protein
MGEEGMWHMRHVHKTLASIVKQKTYHINDDNIKGYVDYFIPTPGVGSITNNGAGIVCCFKCKSKF